MSSNLERNVINNSEMVLTRIGRWQPEIKNSARPPCSDADTLRLLPNYALCIDAPCAGLLERVEQKRQIRQVEGMDHHLS